jgi:alpha-D-xyloside xylohydrolase
VLARGGLDGAVRQVFAISGDQSIYGLGQHQAGFLDYRGTTVRLQQANTDVGVPVLISRAGYGLFWNNAAVTDVAVSTPQAIDQVVFRSESGRLVDYFRLAGPMWMTSSAPIAN